MRISQAFAIYLAQEVVAMNYSVNTYHCYQNVYKALFKRYGDMKIERLDVEKVHEFYLNLIQDHAKDTARQYVSKLRTVIRWCNTRGVRTTNPDLIRIPKATKRSVGFLGIDEYEKFLRAAIAPVRGFSRMNRLRNELVIKMLFYTGLRIGELCALNRNSIHNRQFSVVGKSKEPRPCFITKEIEGLIEQYLEMRQDGNEALFICAQTGERMTPHNVEAIFRLASKKSGVIATPHTLRHSFATRLVEDGVDISFVAAFLGHQSLQTTQKYTHVRNSMLRQIYENTVENKRSLIYN